MDREAVREVARTETVVSAAGLDVFYGRRQVLFDVSIAAGAGEVVCVLGHNGAGKTTLLKTLAGLVAPRRGVVELTGSGYRGRRRVPREVAMVPSERCVFPELSVTDNLRLGGRLAGGRFDALRAQVVELFPILGQRGDQLAGRMSGGEQRMLGVAIGLMREPRLLLLDEPSLGLAPMVAQSLFATVAQLAMDQGIAVIIVEQNIPHVLAVANRAEVLRTGRNIVSEDAASFQLRDNLWEFF